MLGELRFLQKVCILTLSIASPKQLRKTADNFLNICIRALDYCPPVDILFGDYLRAVITADHHLFPDDKYSYRAALIDAFRSRGIIPESVTSFSEESLLWESPEFAGNDDIPICTGLDYDVFSTKDEAEERKNQVKNNADALRAFAKKNAKKLGLSTDYPIEVRRFNVMHHVSDNGKFVVELVVQITQSRNVPIDMNYPASDSFKFRGGITLILGQGGQVLYTIRKSIDEEKDGAGNKRLTRQRDYLLMRQSNLPMASYVDMTTAFHLASKEADFSMIHRGY